MAALTLAIAVFATLITADAEAVIDCPDLMAAPRLAVAVLPTLRAAEIVAVSVFGVYPDAAGTSNSAHVTLTLTGDAAASGSNHPPGVPASSNHPCGTNSLSNVPFRAMDYQQ